MNKITLISPMDAHVHWRQLSTLLSRVAKYTMRQFSRALLMPNTDPKILTYKILQQYRKDVHDEIRKYDSTHNTSFAALFVYYLATELQIDDLKAAWEEKLIAGVKYYPKGGTTSSDKGLQGFSEVTKHLEFMQKHAIPLLIHGETPVYNGQVVDDYERESIFMETEMVALRKEFPELRIVLEHITTKEAAAFALEHKFIRATVTPQHCLLDRRALFNGTMFVDGNLQYDINSNGSHPDFMCRPILKEREHREAICNAIIRQHMDGLHIFGLGTDTAPHEPGKKYCECGACGVFSAPIALELYACAFEQMGILEHLPTFACEIMPDFYDIRESTIYREVTLERVPQLVAPEYDGIVTPFAGKEIPWSVQYN